MIVTVGSYEITIEALGANHLDGHMGFIWECPNCRGALKQLKEIENMHTGMLWFDNSQTALQTKLQKAIGYYHQKYGRMPDLCLLHPATLGDNKIEIKGLTVRPYRPVLPGHMWIGIEDKG